MEEGSDRLAGMMASARNIVQNLDHSLGPAAKQLPEVIAGLQRHGDASDLVLSLDSGYGDNTSSAGISIGSWRRPTIASLDPSADDLLARHPEALIKGRPDGALE